jgi:two-component sensor histidine kinase
MASEPLDTREHPRVSARVVVASIFGLWLCYFLLTTLRGAIVGLEMQDELLWRRALVSVAGVAITFVMWLVLRVFDARPLWAKIVGALVLALPASVLIAQVNQATFSDIEAKVIQQIGAKQGVHIRRDEAGNVLLDMPGVPVAGGTGDPAESDDVVPPAATVTVAHAPDSADRWRQITDIALGRYFLLLAWAALYFALLAVGEARAAERREERFRSAANAAELRSLRYQVNPHFLFNTLNSLSALVMTGKAERAEDMIQAMSKFYRYSLADEPTSDVALADEFALQRHYLLIEAVRFPDRLRAEFDLPEELAEARIPGMMLQPLVENSVKYAVAAVSRSVTIVLAAREEYGRLVVTVSDDGPGIPAGASHGFGIGLANVRDRLRARFGDAASIEAGPVPGGYRSELRLPLVTHD